MYHAKLHPEQYSDTFSDEQLAQLHKSIMHVCHTAVESLADSSKFPDDWIFKYRWGKGKKDAPTTLPNGEKLAFLTVGGRTSCIVPSLQKKTGKVAGDVKKEDLQEIKAEDEKPKKGKGAVTATVEKSNGKSTAGRKRAAIKEETVEGEVDKKVNGTTAKRSKKAPKEVEEKGSKVEAEPSPGRRRSARVSRNRVD
jgi:formamidopyrimidine-DNA glycosylase